MFPRVLQLSTRAKLATDEEAARLAHQRLRAIVRMPVGTFHFDHHAQRLPNVKRRPVAGRAR